MMTLLKLARPHWQAFFDRLAPLLRSHVVEIEVAGIGLGERIPAQWVRLAGLRYIAGDDALEVRVQGADRAIPGPTDIHVREEDGCLESIEIVEASGGCCYLVLREPVHLTA